MSQIKLESELYEPIKKYLLNNGYSVNAEVCDCDIVAQKESKMVIIELKKSINIKLLLQAVERQKITDYVFIAVPRQKIKINTQYYRQLKDLLLKLKLGLITIALDSEIKTVEILIDSTISTQNQNKKDDTKIKKELQGINFDTNIGGSTRRKILTSYRESAIKIACLLYKSPELSLKQIKNIIDDPNVNKIIQKNYYNWFYRIKRGVYTLTEEGKTAIELPIDEFKEIIEYYKSKNY